MSSVIVSLLFDCILAALLIATIGYCSKLSRRIRFLQDSRGELASMIKQFDHATERATTSLIEVQAVSKRITDALQLKIDKANFLADDLAFLIEKSSKLAAQLEQAKTARVEAVPHKPKDSYESHAAFESTPIAKPLPTQSSLTPNTIHSGTSAQSRATKSLEAVLQRLAAQAPATTSPARSTILHMHEPVPPRTDAERELLEALKSDSR